MARQLLGMWVMRQALLVAAVLISLTGCGQSRSEPAKSRIGEPNPPASATAQPPAAAEARPVQIPADAVFRVRLNQSLDTERNRAGDKFTATLEAPLRLQDKVVVPEGTQFTGHVTAAKPSGRLRGRGFIAVTLDSFELNGETYRISTSSRSRASGAHKKRNLALIGGGSGLGATIGAIAGGGKGAAIGAAAGAGAGTAGAAATGRIHVSIPAETVLGFRLKSPVQIRS